MDECIIGSHNCEPTQICENTEGSFTCLDDTEGNNDEDEMIELHENEDYIDGREVPLLDDAKVTTKSYLTSSQLNIIGSAPSSTAAVPLSLRTATVSGQSNDTFSDGYQPTVRYSDTGIGNTCAQGYAYDSARGRCSGLWLSIWFDLSSNDEKQAKQMGLE